MGSNITGMLSVAETLYFTAENDTEGWNLWMSDGTESGTVMVKNINEGDDYDSSNPSTCSTPMASCSLQLMMARTGSSFG